MIQIRLRAKNMHGSLCAEVRERELTTFFEAVTTLNVIVTEESNTQAAPSDAALAAAGRDGH
jgi:hypothetical protein